MSSSVSEIDDTLQMVLLVGIVGIAVWAFFYFKGSIDPNDPLGVGGAANDFGNSVGNIFRSIASGGAKVGLTKQEQQQYGFLTPSLTGPI
jgi:hypothetical protein